MTEDETYCLAVTYPETLETPVEYCENHTLPGEDYCEEHMPWEYVEDDPAPLWDYDDLEPFE